ncbi:MAG: hypothetical protein JWQ09_1724 [Segetibacter sp.]|nr:hypothetical protein [Segetibacter sp.]
MSNAFAAGKRSRVFAFHRKRNQGPPYLIVIQKRKLIFSYTNLLAASGVFRNRIIVAQTALVNNLKHHFATLATKAFFIRDNGPAATVFPAMVTTGLCIGSLFRHNCFFAFAIIYNQQSTKVKWDNHAGSDNIRVRK